MTSKQASATHSCMSDWCRCLSSQITSVRAWCYRTKIDNKSIFHSITDVRFKFTWFNGTVLTAVNVDWTQDFVKRWKDLVNATHLHVSGFDFNDTKLVRRQRCPRWRLPVSSTSELTWCHGRCFYMVQPSLHRQHLARLDSSFFEARLHFIKHKSVMQAMRM
jgi:hypothetical protein